MPRRRTLPLNFRMVSSIATSAIRNAIPHVRYIIFCTGFSASVDYRLLVGLYCTFNNKPSNVARCRAKYCRPCLRNRYGQDSDEIKGRGINGSSKEITGHDKSQGYIFKHVPSYYLRTVFSLTSPSRCPRCNGNCNCRGCRKAMGLEPTGYADDLLPLLMLISII